MPQEFLNTIESLHPTYQHYGAWILYYFLKSGAENLSNRVLRRELETIKELPLTRAFKLLEGCDRESLLEVWENFPGVTEELVAQFERSFEVSDEDEGYEG